MYQKNIRDVAKAPKVKIFRNQNFLIFYFFWQFCSWVFSWFFINVASTHLIGFFLFTILSLKCQQQLNQFWVQILRSWRGKSFASAWVITISLFQWLRYRITRSTAYLSVVLDIDFLKRREMQILFKKIVWRQGNDKG